MAPPRRIGTDPANQQTGRLMRALPLKLAGKYYGRVDLLTEKVAGPVKKSIIEIHPILSGAEITIAAISCWEPLSWNRCGVRFQTAASSQTTSQFKPDG
jgi:hypothetical protein